MNAQTPIRSDTFLATEASVAAAPRSRLRRARPFLALGALAAAVAGGGWWWQVGRFDVSSDNAYLAGDIAPLGSRIEGDVAELLVADNQAVSAGQPLIRLEDQDWRARRDGTAAALAEAEAALAALDAQAAQQRAAIAAAEAALGQAEAERVRAVAGSTRSATLAEKGYGSRERAENGVADRGKAEAALAAAEANLSAARASLPVLEAQGQAALARRDGASAALALAENQLSYTVVRAPFDGVVGNRSAQVGQHVRPGQTLIAVAPPPARQWVVANFKETQLARMRPGQPARVVLDVSGEELTGRVETLSPATGSLFSLLPPENATGNFTRIVQRVPVRIALDRPEKVPALRPGLSAVATVDTRDDPTAPRGPIGAAAAAIGLAR
ncbi:HlyD family secretion protein [Craurococcus roseus]|uniref:HlyD family secretion protein n=1 Tax=Craurococcus roseus TaxID=77585 RepID=A0ABP3QX11_9PROT